jgi:hypothetical protein
MSTTIPTPVPSFTSTTAISITPASSSSASATTSGGAGNIGAAVLSAAVIAALIAAGINLWLARRKSQEEERARIRNTLAEAFQAYASYKEFPYAVRRRRHDQAAEERIRLSEALREVQARLTYFEAWTKTENPEVGAAYAALIAELRKVAGGAIRQAWLDPPCTDDAGMNIPPDVVDLSALNPLEKAYLAAATRHLANLSKWWS